ncbi:unnamed protein product, partial [Ilex paraguariensis]
LERFGLAGRKKLVSNHGGANKGKQGLSCFCEWNHEQLQCCIPLICQAWTVD